MIIDYRQHLPISPPLISPISPLISDVGSYLV